MSRAGRFLLVEDEPLVAPAFVRRIRQRGLGECVVASTAHEARRLLGDGSGFTALIIDIGLPDGSGLDVLAEARQGGHALTPALVRSASYEPRFINRASALEAKYLVKNADDESETLATFLVDANSLERRIAIAVQSRRLSKTLSDIVKRSALGETRGAIAEARGTSVKTVENQAAKAAELTGEGSFHTLIENVLREVARSR
jgi:DNA-binding NarL/FixJ family response regulator